MRQTSAALCRASESQADHPRALPGQRPSQDLFEALARVVSLGFDADGKRIREKVSGQPRTGGPHRGRCHGRGEGELV
jgi:hypothetical protein